MNVAIGIKAHSGWAALVVAGQRNGEFIIVDRRRIELVDAPWQKQPYHAAEKMESVPAHELAVRGIDEVRRIAHRELHAIVDFERLRGNRISGCAVVIGKPMPDWSIEEILAVHIRMHKAEGVLFRDALARAAKACKLRLLELTDAMLAQHAAELSVNSTIGLPEQIVRLGKSLGPPWGVDQKVAALAAMIALR